MYFLWGKKETNIAANKNYWQSKKFLSLFICWLFFSNVMKYLITQQIFFSTIKDEETKCFFFLFLFYLLVFTCNKTKIPDKHYILFSFRVFGSAFNYKQKGSRFNTSLRQLIVYVVQLG